MIVRNSYEGMIFLLYDKCSNMDNSKHNYIILGTNDNNEKLGVLQCMAITSMRKKEIGIEVPILLSNEMVSYIVPYNIHSFTNDEIELKNYKGCITDVDFITKYEFMQLLIDLYADNMDYGLVSHEDVMIRYTNYCEEFWKRHSDNTEFRDVEQAEIDKRKKAREEKEQTCTYDSSLKEDEQKSQTSRYNKLKKRQNSKRKCKPSKKLNRVSKESAKRKQERAEQKEFNEMVRECVGINSTPIEPENEEIIVPIDRTIPYKPDTILSNSIELTDLVALNESPRNSKDFSDLDLLLFLQGYEKFNYDELKSVIPDRWNSPSSFKNFFTSAKKEAINRHISIPVKNGLLPNNIMSVTCSDWMDSDLLTFIEITTNHKNDKSFLLLYTGLETIYLVERHLYQAKKEAQTRGILVL